MMSKKITQLLKTIQKLHNKNSDNEMILKSLSNSREKEIQKVLQRANYIIHKQKIDIEKYANNKSGSTADTSNTGPNNKAHTSRSPRGTDTFNFTGIDPDAMAQKEKQLELQYQTQVLDMKLNLEDIKEKFEDRCKQLKIQLIKVQNNQRKSERQESNASSYKSEVSVSAKHLQEQFIESNRDHVEKQKDLEN